MVVDLVFPRRCVGCGRAGNYICSGCINSLKHPIAICPICHKSSHSGITHRFCRNKYSLDGLTAVFKYEKGIRKVFLSIKYRYTFDMADELTSVVASSLPHDFVKSLKGFTLIPIPI